MIPPRTLPRLAFAIAVLAVALGCRDGNSPTGPRGVAGGPSEVILDGAHGGDRAVFFLPPMVSNPSGQPGYGDPFAAGLAVAFRVMCVACGTDIHHSDVLVKDFAPEVVSMSTTEQLYMVNWDTKEQPLDPSKTYRIEVRIGKQLLAFADVDVASSGKELKKVDTDEFIPLQDGRTLPIKVRVEQGVQVCGESCTSQVVDNTPENGIETIVKLEDNSAAALFPKGWIPEDLGTDKVIVTVEDVTEKLASQEFGCALRQPNGKPKTTMLSGGHCVRFKTDPEFKFATHVDVAVCAEHFDNKKQQLIKYDDDETPVFLRNVEFKVDGIPFDLGCPEDEPRISFLDRSSNRILRLAGHTFSRVGGAVQRLVTPKSLYAIDAGVGGRIEEQGGFSVVAVGEPMTMTPASVLTQTAMIGTPVAVTPRVRITSVHSSVTGLEHKEVRCEASSGGSVGPARAAIYVTETDNEGYATCPNWTVSLAEGTNTLTVTAPGIDDAILAAESNPESEGGVENVQLHGVVTFSAEALPYVLVLNDINHFQLNSFPGGAAAYDNLKLYFNLLGLPGTGRRASTKLMIHRGHDSQCAADGNCTSGTSSFDPFTSALTGYTVVDGDGDVGGIASDVKVLLLMTPQTAYSPSEVNALKQFVGEGGLLVVIGENPGYYSSDGKAAQSKLLGDLGADLRATNEYAACDPGAGPGSGDRSIDPATGGQIFSHAITQGINRLFISCAAKLSIGPSDIALATSNTGMLTIALGKISLSPLPVPTFAASMSTTESETTVTGSNTTGAAVNPDGYPWAKQP